MRHIFKITLIICLSLVCGHAASAEPLVGISSNQPGMFADALFEDLNPHYVRLVTSYNVATTQGEEHQRVREYMRKARASGIQVLVTFEHARGRAEVCKRSARLKQCKLPSVADYRKNVSAFLKEFPQVTLISPWNEMNHFTQPTSRNPARAAQFVNTARQLCRHCEIVVADMLDQPDNLKSKPPTYRKTTKYIKRFRAALKVPRTTCGIHNYSDINRFRDTGTKALIQALGCKNIWLTETGGLFRFGAFNASEDRQVRATRYMFKVASAQPKIKRIYVYTWFGESKSARFDAGLVQGGRARRAYAEVKHHMG